MGASCLRSSCSGGLQQQIGDPDVVVGYLNRGSVNSVRKFRSDQELINLDSLAELRLREQGLAIGGYGDGDELQNLGNRSLKGKKSGIDVVKNYSVVTYPQRCP